MSARWPDPRGRALRHEGVVLKSECFDNEGTSGHTRCFSTSALCLLLALRGTGDSQAAVSHVALIPSFLMLFVFVFYLFCVFFLALNMFVYTISSKQHITEACFPPNLDIFCFKSECVTRLNVAQLLVWLGVSLPSCWGVFVPPLFPPLF